MRVCLVTSAPFPPCEGLGYHVWNLAARLTEYGHQVGIITRGHVGPTQVETRQGVTIWHLPFAPVYPFHVHLHAVFASRFFRRVEDRFDLVNEHTPLPAPLRTSLPMVTTVHSPMQADTAATTTGGVHGALVRMQTPISRRIETTLFRRSRRITTVARWVADALRAYGVDASLVTVTGNGVEAGFLNETVATPRRPFVLSVGRLEPGKGLEDLIEAAAIHAARCPTSALRYVIAGAGSLQPALQAQVGRAGLSDRFEFLGQIPATRRDELRRLYQTAGIFVLPSHHEGMPTVLLEAMAAGAPVIATAVGGALEVVAPGQNGLLVPPSRPDSLAEALIALSEDSALAAHLGRQARETVERGYSWNAVTERYLECYTHALSGRD